jgi:hypothetical protein
MMQYIQWIQQNKLRLITRSFESQHLSQSEIDNERWNVCDFPWHQLAKMLIERPETAALLVMTNPNRNNSGNIFIYKFASSFDIPLSLVRVNELVIGLYQSKAIEKIHEKRVLINR